ncbi:MAG: SpoIIE family protein phosphatase [Longimicrobiales bacterium]|nr:SpoIIE family protein phosphatase [Longimicrobiales bacterium]
MSSESAEKVIEVLGRVPLFQGLPRSDLQRIAALLQPREVNAGEFLFREGDAGDKFYIVFGGAVEVLKERPLGDHELLAVKRGGDAFGEMALLTEAPRSASVRAVEDTRLLSVAKSDFDRLLGGESLSVRLMQGLARALRSLDIRFAARHVGTGGDALEEYGKLVLAGLEPRTAPQAEGFRIAGATARDDAVPGASLWDGFATDDGRTLFTVMDVKGTGLPPAHLLAVTRSLFREIAPREDASQILRRLNTATFANLFEGLDECVEAALIHIRDGTLTWSCAGEQPAVVLRGDGSTDEPPSYGPPLGILPHFEYSTAPLELDDGETLLVFSEARPALVKGAVDLARERAGTEPAELARLLQAALKEIQTRGSETDVSFLVIQKIA